MPAVEFQWIDKGEDTLPYFILLVTHNTSQPEPPEPPEQKAGNRKLETSIMYKVQTSKIVCCYNIATSIYCVFFVLGPKLIKVYRQ